MGELDSNQYDYIVIGSGFTGSVFARTMADKGKKVLVIEKRNEIGGNMYDFINEDGIVIQKYGPHVFHTDSDEVFNFIKRFCDIDEAEELPSSKIVIEGKVLETPFNYTFIDEFYTSLDAMKLKKILSEEFEKEVVSIFDLYNSENRKVKEFAELLIEKDYKPYNKKQWGIEWTELDNSVLKRHPIFLSYRRELFKQKHMGVPKDGFTSLFHNMLKSENIDIITNCDFFDYFSIDFDRKIIILNDKKVSCKILFTGPIDKLGDYKFGKLPYVTLDIDYHRYQESDFQDCACMIYPDNKVKHLRVFEHTKLPVCDRKEITWISYEYPRISMAKDDEPFYPILTQENNSLYKKYLNEFAEFENLIVGGRLADYKYYDMDKAIIRAFELCNKEENGN